MLYERKILSGITDGSSELPSFFRINKARDTESWIVSVSKTGDVLNADDGTFGNNNYSCVVDFCGDPAELKKSDSAIDVLAGKRIRALWSFLESSSNGMAFPKSYLSDFAVAKIPDYGYQTMTAGNYDMEVKVFDQDGFKYPSFNTALIRMYSGKEAFVIVDVSGNLQTTSSTSNAIGMIIIDFRYRPNTVNKTLLGVNSSHNFQDYANNPYLASPYLDMMYFNSNNAFLSYQADYFKLIMKNEYKTALPSLTGGQNWDSDSAKNCYARLNPDSYTVTDYPSIKSSLGKEVANSVAEEIYGYVYESPDLGKYLGKRILPGEQIPSGKKFFETYVTSPKYIKYYLAAVNGSSIDNATLTSATKHLKDNNCFLWDSGFSNIVFVDSKGATQKSANSGNDKAEIIIPMQYSGKGSTVELPNETVDSFFADYIITGLTDERSAFDITSSYGSTFYASADSFTETVIHPYLANDKFVESVLSDKEPELKISYSDPQKYIGIEGLRKLMLDGPLDLENSDFDIFPHSKTRDVPAKLSADTLKTLIGKFSSDLSARSSDAKEGTKASSESSSLADIEKNVIMYNLTKLIPGDLRTQTQNGTEINLESCFAAAVYDSSDKLIVIGTETYGENSTKRVYLRKDSTVPFIIPSDGASKVVFDSEKQYYLIK